MLLGVDYNPDNPPADMVYALNQLQSLALETVLDNPQTVMSYEMVQHGYGCKLLTQVRNCQQYMCSPLLENNNNISEAPQHDDQRNYCTFSELWTQKP